MVASLSSEFATFDYLTNVTVERRREYDRQYYRRNAEKMRSKQRAWKKRNAEKVLAYKRRYYRANQKDVCQKRSEWLREKRLIRVYNNNRRERKLSVESCDPVSSNALTQIIDSLPKMRCSVCGRNMPKRDRTIDHVIPLAKGGTGHIGNLQVVHKGCNSSKHAKMPEALDGQFQIKFAGFVAA